ncbi:MAG: hypothetical protein IJT38_03540 [Clostridia bacterium]|nr:hypothetical protein [Clostridia bacterium]
MSKTNCEDCMYYNLDDYYGYYICEAELDEDEMYRFMEGKIDNCPYWQTRDDYKIVRKQN